MISGKMIYLEMEIVMKMTNRDRLRTKMISVKILKICDSVA